MLVVSRASRALLLPALALLLAGCASSPSADQAPKSITEDKVVLAPCPVLPNCVQSNASNPMHAIAPLALSGEATEVWAALLDHLEGDPQYTIVEQTEGYVRAEARTRVVGFVDDVEFQLREDSGEIAVRSASRVGLFDFGVNRLRIEGVRKALNGN